MGRYAEGWKLEWRGRTGHKIGYVRFSHGKRQHLISTGKRDPGEAAIEAGRLYARVVSGGVARTTSTRSLIVANLDVILAEWLASLAGTLDVRTVETYETTYVGRHWLTHFSSLDEMTDPIVRERYRQVRMLSVSAKTVQKECWVQDKFLRWAHDRGIIAETPPALEWEKRMTGNRTGPQRQVARELTPAQVADVLAALPEWSEAGARAKTKKPYPVRGRFIFMYETSLRPGTLSALAWGDMKGEKLRIRPEVDKVRFGRDVPLSERALAVLAEVRAGAEVRGVPTGAADLIFGDHLYRKTLARAARAAGLDGVAPYDFRHARGTHLADAGASLTGIGHILGHKQATTSARYIHSSEKAAAVDLARGAAFQVDSAFFTNLSAGCIHETPRKQGWPTGSDPATSGATIQCDDRNYAHLCDIDTDCDAQETAAQAIRLGIIPRKPLAGWRAYFCAPEGRHFDAPRSPSHVADCPSCGSPARELGAPPPMRTSPVQGARS